MPFVILCILLVIAAIMALLDESAYRRRRVPADRAKVERFLQSRGAAA
jgi:hypothetical protein